METFKFDSKYVQEPNASIRCGRFPDGSIALRIESSFGEPLTTATVNLAQYGEHPEEGNVFVYGDYGHHEGVWRALYDAGIVGNALRIIEGPFNSQWYECPLLVKVEA